MWFFVICDISMYCTSFSFPRGPPEACCFQSNYNELEYLCSMILQEIMLQKCQTEGKFYLKIFHDSIKNIGFSSSGMLTVIL